MRFNQSVINVCTERRQRNTTVFIAFRTCHLSAVQTTRNFHFNTFCIHAHCRSNCHFDGTTVRDTTLYLTRNTCAYQLGFQLRTLDFKNVHLNFFACDFFKLFFKLVNFLTTLTNDDTRTGGGNGNGNQLKRTLNDYARNACLSKTGVNIAADFIILG